MQKMSHVASKLSELWQFLLHQGDMKSTFHQILKFLNLAQFLR